MKGFESRRIDLPADSRAVLTVVGKLLTACRVPGLASRSLKTEVFGGFFLQVSFCCFKACNGSKTVHFPAGKNSFT